MPIFCFLISSWITFLNEFIVCDRLRSHMFADGVCVYIRLLFVWSVCNFEITHTRLYVNATSLLWAPLPVGVRASAFRFVLISTTQRNIINACDANNANLGWSLGTNLCAIHIVYFCVTYLILCCLFLDHYKCVYIYFFFDVRKHIAMYGIWLCLCSLFIKSTHANS